MTYYDNENGSTIRNGKGSNKIYKNFASLSQIIAISILLGLNNNRYSFINNYNDFVFLIVIPIQLSTFLLTLHKKNFITSDTYGIVYVLSLLVLYSQIDFNDKQFITLTLLMILLRFQNINKYILYIGFALLAEYLRKTDMDIPIIVPIITGCVFLYYFIQNSIEDRPSQLSLSLISKEQITDDTFLLKFKKDGKFPRIPNGHHIIVKNNDIKRPYTPIKETENEVELFIKEYKNGRVSQYLANLNINDKINIDNITGENIYLGNGVFSMKGREVKTNNCINMICAGTGITPVIRILEDNIHINIIHCIRDKKDIVTDKIIKKTDKIKVYTHISNESGRINLDIIKTKLDNNDNVILVCGTKIFNEEIESILLKMNISKKLIIMY